MSATGAYTGRCARRKHFPVTPHIVRVLGYDVQGRAIFVQAVDVSDIVEREILRIADSRIAARIRALAVTPYPVERSWDYGELGERYTCWTVIEHPESNTGIAYCVDGFGPSNPWGLVFLSGHMNIGMDCAWYASLEDAFRESMAWDEPSPEGFELQ
jgi:hypothetical protein